MKKSFKWIFSLVAVAVIFMAGTLWAYDFGKIDLGGKTVKIVAWHDLVKELDEQKPGRVAAVEEKYNCKIEFVGFGWDNYTEGLMNRLLAGDSVYDIWKINHDFFWELMPQGAFYPVNEILPGVYYKTLPAPHQNIIDNLSYNGKKYGFSAYGNLLGAMRFVAWNRDLFEREGLPDLYELYKNDEWTWDKAIEIAKKATKDFDGDGEIDQWGWSTVWRYDLAFANGARITSKDSNGKIIFTFDNKNALEALETYYQWTQVDKVVLSGDWGGDNFKAGKVAMQPLEFWRIDFMNKDFNFRFGIVPLPKGPSATRYGYPQLSMETLVLPANAENPKALIAIADDLFAPEDYYEGLQGVISKTAPDRLGAQIIVEGLKTWDGDIIQLGSVLPAEWSQAMQAIDAGEKTPAAAIAEVKDKVQANIDEMFNQ